MGRTQKPLAMIVTLFIMYVITGLALLCLAFLLYRFQLSEQTVTIGILVIYTVSCLAGGGIAGKKMKNRRFFWGMAAGSLYFAILAAGSLVIRSGADSDILHRMMTFIICAAAGMIGGMLSSRRS